MQFGDILRWLIDENELSQKQLAADLHMATSTLGNYVRNLREPDFKTLKLFAVYFNVDMNYLLDYHPEQGANDVEEELLRAFRSLPPEQQRICLEQTKAAAKVLGEKS